VGWHVLLAAYLSRLYSRSVRVVGRLHYDFARRGTASEWADPRVGKRGWTL